MDYKKLLKNYFLIIIILLLQANICLNAEEQKIETNFKGFLYGSVFYGFIPKYNPSKLIELKSYKTLPENLKNRINTYIERSKKFHSRLKYARKDSNSNKFPFNVILEKKQTIEKAIVSLIEIKNIENIAFNYINDATIAYEWEGMSDGPLGEAGYAEYFLKDNPKTVIKPYIYLFLIHRYKCAIEYLNYEKKQDVKQEVFKKYNLYLKYATEFPDILIQEIAKDIDINYGFEGKKRAID